MDIAHTALQAEIRPNFGRLRPKYGFKVHEE